MSGQGKLFLGDDGSWNLTGIKVRANHEALLRRANSQLLCSAGS